MKWVNVIHRTRIRPGFDFSSIRANHEASEKQLSLAVSMNGAAPVNIFPKRERIDIIYIKLYMNVSTRICVGRQGYNGWDGQGLNFMIP